jgi:hypothetical protein
VSELQHPYTLHTQAFFVGDTTRLGIYYAFFLVGKRVYLAAVFQLTDGELNAMLSIAAQALDTSLLLALRPFNDGEVSLNEALSGLSTLAAYLCLGLPIFLGEEAYVGEVTTLVLCTFGVAVSAFTGALNSVQQLLSGALHGVQWLTTLVSDVVAIGSDNDIVAEAADVVSGGVEGAFEAAEEVSPS